MVPFSYPINREDTSSVEQQWIGRVSTVSFCQDTGLTSPRNPRVKDLSEVWDKGHTTGVLSLGFVVLVWWWEVAQFLKQRFNLLSQTCGRKFRWDVYNRILSGVINRITINVRTPSTVGDNKKTFTPCFLSSFSPPPSQNSITLGKLLSRYGNWINLTFHQFFFSGPWFTFTSLFSRLCRRQDPLEDLRLMRL